MEEPCDICGDVGGPDSVFTCCECKINRSHMYCMKGKTTRQEPLDFWACEECEESEESRKKLSPKSGRKVDFPETPISTPPAMVEHDTNGSGSSKKLCNSGRSHFKEKVVDKGKTKYISCQEAINLSSGSRKLDISSKKAICSGPRSSKSNPPKIERTIVKPKGVSPKITVKANPSFGCLGASKPRKPAPSSIARINPMAHQPMVKSQTALKEYNAVLPTRNEGDANGQHTDALKCVEEVDITNKEIEMEMEYDVVLPTRNEADDNGRPTYALECAEEVETTIKEIEMEMGNSSFASSLPSGSSNVDVGSSDAENTKLGEVVPEVEEYSPYIPALHTYWKGTFKLPNRFAYLELDDGFKAHPSSLVHHKVFEILKKIPEVLQFELVPRNEVWSDMFTDCPYKDDIGLYFFPGHGERLFLHLCLASSFLSFEKLCCLDCETSFLSICCNEKYISFVEFIWTQELVLKSCINGVELLVLSSKVLHLDSQKWKGNYFLWGVFCSVKRCKNKDLVLHDSHIEGEDSKEADMDIDTVALPWPDVKQEPCDDIPPGFEKARGLNQQ